MDDRELEDLLNRSLTNYSVAEPLTGLEDRVLGHVRSSSLQRSASGWRFWRWAIIPALMAAVFIGFWQKEPVKVERTPAQSLPLVSHLQPEPPKTVPQRKLARPHKPIVARLSDQELLLVRFVKADPVGAANTFAGVRERAARELTIEPLKVEPISLASLEEVEKR